MRVERVRMGIVGIGNIAQLNVRGYLQHERCDVVALLCVRQARRGGVSAWRSCCPP